MRLRENLKKQIFLKKRTVVTDDEANKYNTFGNPISIMAITWQASGTIQAQQYGENLSYIRNMHYDGSVVIAEGDCLCINVASTAEPDYEVIAVNTDYSPKVYTLRYRNGR